jgi:hypothetical protein
LEVGFAKKQGWFGFVYSFCCASWNNLVKRAFSLRWWS